MENEIWKDIEGFEGLYQVSNFGRIKSLDRIVEHSRYGKMTLKGCFINLNKQKKGYLRLNLCKNGKMTHFLVHRLVAIAFIQNNDNYNEVNHKNGIKTDNNVQNLEWVTTSNNLKHAFSIGLKNFKGDKHPQSKLTKDDVINIRSINNITNPEIAKMYNVTSSLISRIKLRKVWKHI